MDDAASVPRPGNLEESHQAKDTGSRTGSLDEGSNECFDEARQKGRLLRSCTQRPTIKKRPPRIAEPHTGEPTFLSEASSLRFSLLSSISLPSLFLPGSYPTTSSSRSPSFRVSWPSSSSSPWLLSS